MITKVLLILDPKAEEKLKTFVRGWAVSSLVKVVKFDLQSLDQPSRKKTWISPFQMHCMNRKSRTIQLHEAQEVCLKPRRMYWRRRSMLNVLNVFAYPLVQTD